MKTVDFLKEVREEDAEKVQGKLKDLEQELMNFRFQKSGGQLKSPAAVGSLRRNIARVKTVLREKSGEQQ